jgi:cation transport ATPase
VPVRFRRIGLCDDGGAILGKVPHIAVRGPNLNLSAGARRGLLLKGGAVLETLAWITAAAFDKTGTLTEGKPKVTDVVALGRSEKDVLSLAAALEGGSNHPLALAILERAKATACPSRLRPTPRPCRARASLAGVAPKRCS